MYVKVYKIAVVVVVCIMRLHYNLRCQFKTKSRPSF